MEKEKMTVITMTEEYGSEYGRKKKDKNKKIKIKRAAGGIQAEEHSSDIPKVSAS